MKRLFLALMLVCNLSFAECDSYVDGYCQDEVDMLSYNGLNSEPSVSNGGTAKTYYNVIDDKYYISKDGAAYEEIGGGGSTVSVDGVEVTDPNFVSTGDTTFAVAGSDISTVINENAVEESMLKAVDSPADEDILTYEVTTGDFEWQSKSDMSIVDGSGTQNYVSKWSDSDTLTDSVMYDDGTNVGIGTTAPVAALDVVGSSQLDGAVTINEASADVDFRVETNGDANAIFAEGGTDNVGIGTNAPVQKFVVVGQGTFGSNAVAQDEGGSGTISNGDEYDFEYNNSIGFTDGSTGSGSWTVTTFDGETVVDYDGPSGGNWGRWNKTSLPTTGDPTVLSYQFYPDNLGLHSGTEYIGLFFSDESTERLSLHIASDGTYVQNNAGVYNKITSSTVTLDTWNTHTIKWYKSTRTVDYYECTGKDCSPALVTSGFSGGRSGTQTWQEGVFGNSQSNAYYMDWLKFGTDFAPSGAQDLTTTIVSKAATSTLTLGELTTSTDDGSFAVEGKSVFVEEVYGRGDLIVDTDTLFVDVSEDKVGINTTTPAQPLHVSGISLFTDALYLTQTDGNEKIDSGADGYLDLTATTANRFNMSAADTDILTTWVGTTNSGSITWMEDEDEFMFEDDITFNTSAGLFYGGISVKDNVTTTTLNSSAKVQLTVMTTNDTSNGMTPDHTNDHITVNKTGVYLALVSAGVQNNAAQTHVIEIGLYKNNGATSFDNVHRHRTLTGGNTSVGSMDCSGVVSLTANDTIEVWADTDSGSDRSVTFEDLTLTLVQVGG